MLAAIVACASLNSATRGDEPADTANASSEQILAAVARGLPIIEKAAANYPNHRKCFSCHHQTLPMLAIVAARGAGMAKESDLLKTQMEFTAESFGRQVKDLNAGKGVGGRGLTVSYGLWTYQVAQRPADATTEAMVTFLVKTQEEDGHWAGQAVRPPMEESFALCTALAIYGLQHYASPAQKEEVDAAVAKARNWLANCAPANQEDRNGRLWGLFWLESDAEAIQAARDAALAAQHEDGGWSPSDDLASDAYATGQTLYVLQATGLAANAPQIQRGIAWLLKTQLPDGSWLVETRSKPVQVLFDNGDPHGKNQFISTPSTCWSLAALAASQKRAD